MDEIELIISRCSKPHFLVTDINPEQILSRMTFESLLDDAAKFITDNDDFTLVSHSDADGICSTAILQRALDSLGKQYDTQWLEQISTLALETLEATNTIVFIDMGSSHMEHIEKLFSDRNVLVIDHHQGAKGDILIVNPELAGLDGTKDACTSSIAFEIASRVTETEKVAPLALIGAQADHQEPFQGYNKTILDACIERMQITTRRGARLFGVESKPLIPLLAYSYDLQITGVTGSQDGAEKLLQELEIEKRYFGQLSQEEKDLLDETLIRRSKNPEATITFYTLEGMPRGPLRDTREAASLVNACGKLGKPDLAVEVLLTRDSLKATEAHRKYRSKIKEAHTWYKENPHEPEGNLLLLNAEDKILPSVAGSLCSSLVRGKQVPEGTVVVCLARYGDGTTKVSSRTDDSNHNLAKIMESAAAKVGGEGGGHDCAAGAIIPSENEDQFLEFVRQAFDQ